MALTKVRTDGLTDDAVTTDKLYTPNLGRRNIVINGAMKVAQRGTNQPNRGNNDTGYYTVDRFHMAFAGSTAGRLTMSQESISDLSGFSKAIKLACTTADTSIAADEVALLEQKFEGQDLQQLKKGTSDAEKVTVSFYVKGNAAATYTVELEDNDNSRFASQEFSVTTSWTKVTKTFVADTTGTLDDDNAVSLSLKFWFHGGSTYTGGTHTSNTWHTTTNARLSDNQTSFFDSTSRTFFITGLQMEVGEQATPFEHRSFGEELNLCRRYYYVNNSVDCCAYWDGGNAPTENFIHPVQMRSAPSVSITRQSSDGNVNSITIRNITNNAFNFFFTSASSNAMQNFGHNGNEATYVAEAEL
tara:strand:+ start:27 stop:1100 length:1074 start_codon:yes stop_codon:yes gene_type:complete